jgi:hypothetical protein
MTDTEDKRNEVYLSKHKLDTSSGYIIEEHVVSLKSKDDSVSDLLLKAKDTLKEVG